jgi:hypothetical protein
MSYFSTFPYIEYQYPDDVIRIIKNISIRPSIVEEFFGVHSNFETYDVQDGDTPETLAYDFYGDVNLHWAIMLTNNVLNIYKDWPKATSQLDSYLRDKYGKAVTNKGNTVTLNDEQFQRFIEFEGNSTNQWKELIVINDSETVEIKPKHFEDDRGVAYSYDTVIQDSDLLFDAFNRLVFRPANLQAVSYYDYEARINDKKRSIIIPKFETIQQMKTELNNIVNE